MGISHHSRCGGQPVAVGVFGELPAGGEPLVVSAAGTAKPWLRLVDGGVVVPPVEDRPHHSVGAGVPPGVGAAGAGPEADRPHALLAVVDDGPVVQVAVEFQALPAHGDGDHQVGEQSVMMWSLASSAWMLIVRMDSSFSQQVRDMDRMWSCDACLGSR